MNVTFACPECGLPERLPLASREWRCPGCDHFLNLHAPPGPLHACAVCGNGELYKKKDFPHWLGLTILTVACVKIIGAVLVEALLLIPAAAARNLNRSIRGFVLWSIAFSTVSCLIGVWAPMRFEIPVPSGGAIILTAAAIFLVTLVIRMTVPRFREASL